MRKPLIYSFAIHVALIVVTIFGLPARKLEPVELKALPVDLLTVADVTNLRRLAKKLPKTPKPVEQPTPPKPEPEQPKAKVEPAAEPKAEPEKPAEEKAEPIPDKEAQKKPEEKKPEPPKPEKKKPAPDKKPEKKKKKFDPTDLAALLNKLPDSSTPPAEVEKADKDLNVEKTDDPSKPVSVDAIDGFRQKVQKCWNAGDLAATLDADKMYADLSFQLGEDGSVVGVPAIDEIGPGNSRLLAERARKAIIECAPYDNLKTSSYQNWKDVTAHFTLDGMM